ncbi:hypothetical protein [Aureitalea marina]|uniref:Uncharacterized protein n=1 Tax=Aureitalea marina TaxID=930804 RepID=A0A2S7KTA7_9FLAO|nr:hypothetical protein [Aureitalea marina]PQB05818.1 hypothetical protein BST85_13615 [Aureitalea marina]
MSSTIKPLIALLVLALTASSCIIHNPQPEDCEQKQIVVQSITEGSAYDIVFTEANGDFYYINRGLEQGLDLTQLQDKLLNKKVNLHLAKTMAGTSNHIAQLTLDGSIVFTEFD